MTRKIEISSGEIEVGTVSGVNNRSDLSRLLPHELAYAYNIDISDKGRPSRRYGSTKVVTPSGSIHSMWGDNKKCFYVEAGTLKMLNTDYSNTVMRNNVTDYPMSFCEVNDKYFYSNASVIGYVYQDTNVLLTTPADEFKHIMPAGQHIEYYKGRLYVARNETIWYSDVNYFGQVDRRRNFIQFENEITMMKAVDNGMWITIGDENRQATYFLGGKTREEFELRSIAGYGCIEGTAVKVKDGSKVGDGLKGTVVIWTADEGICIGANDGQFVNITKDKYDISESRFGAGLFREENGMAQYISTLWS